LRAYSGIADRARQGGQVRDRHCASPTLDAQRCALWPDPNRKSSDTEQQLDLLGDASAPMVPAPMSRARAKPALPSAGGNPRLVPISHIDEDPANPRTEFPDAKVTELADDIRQRGILEPLVVHPENSNGHYLLHFGAMQLRAAARAGLHEVPVVVRDAPADRYAQVAENLKRHSLSPLDLARFVRDQRPR
jgi:ParB family chromosome partitioning protein